MSPVQTTLNVGRRLPELEQMLAEQRQGLGQLCAQGVSGAWDAYDAIYDASAPSLLCGSSPRMKAVTR